jgi:hypothetical protein
MLKVTIHAGPSKDASLHNRLDWLDIAYENLAPIADYKIAFFQDGFGAFCPATLKSYPRWSGSIWDLVMRSILIAQNTESAAHGVSECIEMKKSEFGLEQFPSIKQMDKKFAYATRISAFITHYPGRQGSDIRLIGTADIEMVRGKGNYVATFTEHAGNQMTTGLYAFTPAIMDVSLHLANAIAMAFVTANVKMTH